MCDWKRLLAACFWFLAVIAYLGYVRAPGPMRYLLVALCLALSLLSKPMAVTLPFLLLVFDVWPLQRGLGVRTVTDVGDTTPPATREATERSGLALKVSESEPATAD